MCEKNRIVLNTIFILNKKNISIFASRFVASDIILIFTNNNFVVKHFA